MATALCPDCGDPTSTHGLGGCLVQGCLCRRTRRPEPPPTLQTEQEREAAAYIERLDRCIAIAKTNLAFLEKARAEALAGDFEASHRTTCQHESYLLTERAGGDSVDVVVIS